MPGDVGGEVFDVDLDPGPVGGQQLQRHAPFLPDQHGLVAVGDERGFDGVLGRPVRLVRVPGQHQQPLRGLARFHASRAFPSAREEACAELTAEAQVALHLAEPAGETARDR